MAAAHMLVTLLDPQFFSTRCLHQPFAHAVVAPGIGRKTNRLALHSRIHVDALQLRGANHAHAHARLDRGPQHLFGASLAQPAAPTRHTRRIDRKTMLKVSLAAELLLIGIFNPHSNHVLVAQVMLILQVIKRHHQSRRDPRSILLE